MPVTETFLALNQLHILLYLEVLGLGMHTGLFGISASGIKSRPNHKCGAWLDWVHTEYAAKSYIVMTLGL